MPAPPPCFSRLGRGADYTDGSWRRRDAPKPYRINVSLWEALGTSIRGTTPQHYGRCDDAAPGRSLYDWQPNACSLARFDRTNACRLLAGRSLLFVGDSTVFQLFLSFAMLLGSRLGRNSKRASTVSELSASACLDTVRLAFVRSDLLLWTASSSDFGAVKRCDGFTTLQPFAQRAARDADIVVLGLGHHFPGSLDMALSHSKTLRHFEKEGGGGSGRGGSNNGLASSVAVTGSPSLRCLASAACRGAHLAHHGFFAYNLNNTLSSLAAARASWGQRDAASSVLLVGTTTPVAGCSRFTAPIQPSEYAMASYEHRRTVDSPMWLSYARMNQLGAWVARGLGMHFLDVAAPTAQRPDGAMARFWRESWASTGKIKEDCVHYCMPGPVDAISTMVYNWVAANSEHYPNAEHEASTMAAAGSEADGGDEVGTAHVTTTSSGRRAQQQQEPVVVDEEAGPIRKLTGAKGEKSAKGERSAKGDKSARGGGSAKRLATVTYALNGNSTHPGSPRAHLHTTGGHQRERGLGRRRLRSSNWTNGFFALTQMQWLGERGASARLEHCAKSGAGPMARCGIPAVRLSRQWFWPFNCSG